MRAFIRLETLRADPRTGALAPASPVLVRLRDIAQLEPHSLVYREAGEVRTLRVRLVRLTNKHRYLISLADGEALALRLLRLEERARGE